MPRTRRQFLTSLATVAASAGLAGAPGWAAVGAPDFLAAARFADGTHRLAGLSRTGELRFTLPLPGRGHAAAAHPQRPEAVAFARRPGDFALVIDCARGRTLARLTASEGRHFYGHGVFSPDGARLYTTENAYDSGTGMVGIWDGQSFERVGEFPSGGVGPHDMALLPDGRALVVANGGIETHPASGRAKLNIPMMAPNLAYLTLDGRPLTQLDLAPALHKNSIRHLAIGARGEVAFAMQWQGGDRLVPLLGRHAMEQDAQLFRPDDRALRRMRGYAGSVAISGDGRQVAITSPRGGVIQIHDMDSGALVSAPEQPDVCGLGALTDGFLFTTGTGVIGRVRGGRVEELARHDCQWDNHLVGLG